MTAGAEVRRVKGPPLAGESITQNARADHSEIDDEVGFIG